MEKNSAKKLFELYLLQLFLWNAILGTDVCLEDDGGSVTNNCIGCICEASTRCDTNVTCINNGFLCGPFYISKPFWIDAGRCVQPGDNPENPDGKKSLLNGFYFLSLVCTFLWVCS